MKMKILLALLSIVLVAGCTNMNVPGLDSLGGSGATGLAKGLEITGFSADPTTVYSGSRVRVSMDVQNLGGTSVATDKAFVYLQGTNVDLDSQNSKYWTSGTGHCQKFTSAMDPVDVVRGTPADEKHFTWSLTAPQLTAGQTRTDTFYGRIYSDYSTSVNGNIWVYKEGEADAARSSSRAMNRASFTTTPGPVALSVRVSPDPVVYYNSNEEFTLHITISNNAAGTVYKNGVLSYGNCDLSIESEEYNQVYIDLDYDNAKMTLLNAGECETTQELPAGRSTTVVCDFTLKNEPATFESYPIKVDAKYGYYLEKSVSVVVQGKEGTVTPATPSDDSTDDGSSSTVKDCWAIPGSDGCVDERVCFAGTRADRFICETGTNCGDCCCVVKST